MVSWARRVIGKYKIMESVQDKMDFISHRVKEVISLFTPLVNKGIPFFWEEKGPLLTQEKYLEKLVHRRSDHNKFEDMQHALSGPVVFNKLAGELEELFDFKDACTKVPNITHSDNMELKVMAHKMVIVYFLGLSSGDKFKCMDRKRLNYSHEDIKEDGMKEFSSRHAYSKSPLSYFIQLSSVEICKKGF